MAFRNLKATQLKALLSRIGAPASGTKSELEQRLARDLTMPRLPLEHEASLFDIKPTRILSIDMGIKNLAFCVADVELPSSESGVQACTKFHRSTARMSVIDWRRIDVSREIGHHVLNQSTLYRNQAMSALSTRSSIALSEPYHPSTLSLIAYNLITTLLLPHNPDIVLIERQRYMAGNRATAILEWTMRVNMFESIIWATMRTLREEALKENIKLHRGIMKHPVVFDVNPKLVALYWLDPQESLAVARRRESATIDMGPEGDILEAVNDDKTATQRLSPGKVKKNAKIQLVRSWISLEQPSTSAATPGTKKKEYEGLSEMSIEFSFAPKAEITRSALCSVGSTRKKRKTDMVNEEVENLVKKSKLDDLADCFLQAAAWVAWEGNRRSILKAYEDESDGTGKLVRTDASNIERKKTKRRNSKQKTDEAQEVTARDGMEVKLKKLKSPKKTGAIKDKK